MKRKSKIEEHPDGSALEELGVRCLVASGEAPPGIARTSLDLAALLLDLAHVAVLGARSRHVGERAHASDLKAIIEDTNRYFSGRLREKDKTRTIQWIMDTLDSGKALIEAGVELSEVAERLTRFAHQTPRHQLKASLDDWTWALVHWRGYIKRRRGNPAIGEKSWYEVVYRIVNPGKRPSRSQARILGDGFERVRTRARKKLPK